MFIQKIRQSKNKLRVPLIIMVVALAFGLVGSFAVWSSPNLATNDNTQIDFEQIIANYQASIDGYKEDLKQNPKDFGVLKAIADARYDQAQVYAQIENNEKSSEVFFAALENYLAALDNAPVELNNQGKADIMVDAAFSAWSSNQAAVADSLYQQAIELVPDHFNGLRNYAIFLAFQKQDYPNALTQLNALKESLKDGDENIAAVDELIKAIESIANAADSASEKNENSAEENNN